MTTALVIVGLLLAGLLAYRLITLPAALRARRQPAVAQSLGALQIDPVVALADQVCSDLPWAASLAPKATGGRLTQTLTGVKQAGDWYDPTVESYPVTYNEFGFVTSPQPAPLGPNGAVPITNADVCAWVGHQPAVDGVCPRCGVQL